MTDQKDVIGGLANQRLTAVRIGEILGVTEKTARKRLSDGLTASDGIAIARGLEINPVEALVALRFLSTAEVMDYVDTDGQLLATADDRDLIVELADRTMTTGELAELVSRRTRTEAPAAQVTDLAERHRKSQALPDHHATESDDDAYWAARTVPGPTDRERFDAEQDAAAEAPDPDGPEGGA